MDVVDPMVSRLRLAAHWAQPRSVCHCVRSVVFGGHRRQSWDVSRKSGEGLRWEERREMGLH